MRINAFGQRIINNPYLRFADPPEGGDAGQGGGKTDDAPRAPEPVTGFPEHTPLEQMTVEQREAYWKHQARKHEGIAKSRADYDKLKADSDELAQLKAANQSEQEKALEEARDEARREGENIGAQRYLADAVKGRFQALTGKSDEEIETAFSHVDATTFTNDQGDIDVDALKAFAGTFGKADENPAPQTDRIADALNRQSGPVTGNPGSISAMKQQAVERLTNKS